MWTQVFLQDPCLWESAPIPPGVDVPQLEENCCRHGTLVPGFARWKTSVLHDEFRARARGVESKDGRSERRVGHAKDKLFASLMIVRL